jgi:RNA:NAD 2'-phosphotransferase (TPT1/KptA family)
MDPLGWVSLDEIKALKKFSYHNFDDALQASNPRFEYDAETNKVRALYGHSIKGIDPKIQELSHDILIAYHGTSQKTYDECILPEQMVKSMARNFVHMTTSVDEAYECASRHCDSNANVVVLVIDIPKLREQGNTIYTTGQRILCHKVSYDCVKEARWYVRPSSPPKFVRVNTRVSV